MSTATLLRYQPTFTDRCRSSSASSNNSNTCSSESSNSPGRTSPTTILHRNTLEYHQSLVSDKQGELGRLNRLINNLKSDEQCYKLQLVDWYTTAENELNQLKDKCAQLQNSNNHKQ